MRSYEYNRTLLVTVGLWLACVGAGWTRDYPQTFANWQAEYFTTLQLVDQSVCGAYADPDGDGLSNLQEYAFGLDPTHADTRRGVTGMVIHSNGASLFYTRPSAPADLVIVPEVSTNLLSWAPGVALATNTSPPTGTGVLQKVDEEVVLQSDAPALYARLQATLSGRAWKEEIVWRNTANGEIAQSFVTGTNLVGVNTLISSLSPSTWIIEQRGDLDHNGQRDFVLRNANTHQVWFWLLNDTTFTSTNSGLIVSPTQWRLEDMGDLNGDGMDDILWRNISTGALYLWTMNGGTVVSSDCITDSLASYMTVTTGYFGDNGKKDILVRNQNTGLLYIWLMDGPTILSINLIDSSMLSSDWLIRSVADFDGDGYDDILLWNASSRQLGIWFMDGVSVRSKELVTTLSSDWSVQTVSDFNGDHKADLLLLRSSTGEVRVWIMDGSTIATWAPIMTVSSHWVVVP